MLYAFNYGLTGRDIASLASAVVILATSIALFSLWEKLKMRKIEK